MHIHSMNESIGKVVNYGLINDTINCIALEIEALRLEVQVMSRCVCISAEARAFMRPLSLNEIL